MTTGHVTALSFLYALWVTNVMWLIVMPFFVLSCITRFHIKKSSRVTSWGCSAPSCDTPIVSVAVWLAEVAETIDVKKSFPTLKNVTKIKKNVTSS